MAERLLPPEILTHYRKGEYANRIVEWPAGVFNWPPDFVEATTRNQGRFAIGERGGIIDKSTGEQPPQFLGFPFPVIDPTDSQAAVKILWNYFYLSWYWGNIHVEAQVNWVGPRGLERRTDQSANFLYRDGVPPRDRTPNPHNISVQQLMVV